MATAEQPRTARPHDDGDVQAPSTGYALIDQLAASKLFGDYVSAFPAASRDAGDMLRVAVQVGLVGEYQVLLEQALRAGRAVPDEAWHALLAKVSWPRSLPEWDRGPIGDWRLRWNHAATANWPEDSITGCRFGFRHPERAWPKRKSIWERISGWFVDRWRRRAILKIERCHGANGQGEAPSR